MSETYKISRDMFRNMFRTSKILGHVPCNMSGTSTIYRFKHCTCDHFLSTLLSHCLGHTISHNSLIKKMPSEYISRDILPHNGTDSQKCRRVRNPSPSNSAIFGKYYKIPWNSMPPYNFEHCYRVLKRFDREKAIKRISHRV